MGGVEGSILDAYGGEYAFNNWTVYLYSARGQARNLTIRYGVNMLDYNEDYDASGTFSSVIPYWTDGNEVVLGDRVDSGAATITGRGETVPLDVSDKFESKPTKADVETEAAAYLSANNTALPKQTIKIEFVRLQDLGFEWLDNLLTCELCDTINVIFPDYNSSGRFKIVKTVWDVLADRFESMELGELSTTLSEALGITNGLGGGGTDLADFVEKSDIAFANGWKNGANGYTASNLSLAGSTYLGQEIDLGAVGSQYPIFNGFNIHGTGTARIHTLGHYVFQDGGHWKAYIKMRNDNTSAISSFSVTAYITWITL